MEIDTWNGNLCTKAIESENEQGKQDLVAQIMDPEGVPESGEHVVPGSSDSCLVSFVSDWRQATVHQRQYVPEHAACRYSSISSIDPPAAAILSLAPMENA